MKPSRTYENGNPGGGLSLREHLAISVQRAVGWVLAPLWIPASALVMRFVMGWRIRNVREVRREYHRILRESSAPLLICPNHLTLVDSFVVAWALGSPGWHLLHYKALPWNVPEQANFAATWWSRFLVYVMKCVPIHRRSDRREIGRVLARLVARLRRGDAVLVFPEGGRSRTGRVNARAGTYGVGRLVNQVPGCRVLCVYLRGEHQEHFSDLPARNERFHVELRCIEPRPSRPGLRGSVEVTRQVLSTLADMEMHHLGEDSGRVRLVASS